jgi:hypothetical protein
MNPAIQKLKELKEELYKVSKEANAGTSDRIEAADRIVLLREEIARIAANLSSREMKISNKK